ncbi:hypothetical protein KIH74_16965 [Kineosporia sp. J2-2]|uniref:histidine kinase n=1 Tax=Kineosporia corallincola TaxID=2835133 RepID=A0ABS5THS0_9ACTN|nr:ATP-binding protein [Kineosporia corallincola]MBT0770637.1 hypothetical protein [Kineosporia corallincola]
MTSAARPPRRSPSPWLVGALVAGAAAWARHRSAPWPDTQHLGGSWARIDPPASRTGNPPVLSAGPDPTAPEAEAARERRRVADLQRELEHMLKVRLPAALAGTRTPGADRPDDLAPETAALLEEMLSQIGTAMLEREESRRLALVELASRVQTSAHRIQQAMSGLAEKHPGDPDLLETTMRVDHAATQQARHAQSVKVLCDEWPGQQWPAPLALVDVARAASGRIVAFSRVQVTGDQTVASVPSVVEPLIHLVAELLANATEYSAPSAPVTVSVRGVQRGAVIEIDDSGFGLDEYRLAEAREIVSGRRLLNVGDVGEIPQTGFAVVGRFARRHGLTVDLGMSPYGGVRAVVLVPSRLIETVALPAPVLPPEPAPSPVSSPVPNPVLNPAPDPAPNSMFAPTPAPASTIEPPAAPTAPVTPAPPASLFEPHTPVGTDPAEPVDGADVQLPQRRSRRRDQTRPFGGDPAGRPRPVVSTAPATAPEEAGDWMERFFEGSQPIPVTPAADSPTETPSTDAAVNEPTTNDSDPEGEQSSSTTRKDAAQG